MRVFSEVWFEKMHGWKKRWVLHILSMKNTVREEEYRRGAHDMILKLKFRNTK